MAGLFPPPLLLVFFFFCFHNLRSRYAQTNVTIENVTAVGNGGVIFAQGAKSILVDQSTITNATALGGNGGFVWAAAPFTLRDSKGQ